MEAGGLIGLVGVQEPLDFRERRTFRERLCNSPWGPVCIVTLLIIAIFLFLYFASEDTGCRLFGFVFLLWCGSVLVCAFLYWSFFEDFSFQARIPAAVTGFDRNVLCLSAAVVHSLAVGAPEAKTVRGHAVIALATVIFLFFGTGPLVGVFIRLIVDHKCFNT